MQQRQKIDKPGRGNGDRGERRERMEVVEEDSQGREDVNKTWSSFGVHPVFVCGAAGLTFDVSFILTDR